MLAGREWNEDPGIVKKAREINHMATMITEVYDAFLAGGAPEAKALSSESLSTKGDIVKTEGRLARDIVAAEERLNDKITEVREDLSGEIAAVEQRLNHKIDVVKEELTRRIDRKIDDLKVDQKIDNLKRDIAKLDRDMAVMKTLLLIIIATQVIPLLKALSVI